MIIDLKALRQRGIKEKSFEFSYLPQSNLISLPEGKFIGDVKICGTVEVYDDEAYLSGSVTYAAATVCSRCLAPIEFERNIAFDERFLSDLSLEKDDYSYRYSRDKIDLSQMVDELILTDMPYAVYCKDDCKGLCPKCGKNLNDGDCGCENL